MTIYEQCLYPILPEKFRAQYIQPKYPYAAASKTRILQKIPPWNLLSDILNRHDNCWLPTNGALPSLTRPNHVRLNMLDAKQGFDQGRTVLVRHAEQAHPELAKIADEFVAHLSAPVDLHLCFTPSGHEGFDWHYGAEDIFVIQIAGYKEFFLRENSVNPSALGEMQCLLAPGDFLYIPAGYWHSAVAMRDSFHLSAGVLIDRSMAAFASAVFKPGFDANFTSGRTNPSQSSPSVRN